MAQHVQPGRSGHSGRQRSGVLRVEKAQRRFQAAMRDAGFGMHPDEVKHGHSGGFAAGACGGRNRDQGFERAGNGLALADGRIDVIEEVRR